MVFFSKNIVLWRLEISNEIFSKLLVFSGIEDTLAGLAVTYIHHIMTWILINLNLILLFLERFSRYLSVLSIHYAKNRLFGRKKNWYYIICIISIIVVGTSFQQWQRCKRPYSLIWLRAIILSSRNMLTFKIIC